MATTADKSPRLAMIEAFTVVKPTTDFEHGYFTCLMDEAAEDIDEAGSDIFNRAMSIVKADHRSSLLRQRAITLR